MRLVKAEMLIQELIIQTKFFRDLAGEEYPEMKNKFGRQIELLSITNESIQLSQDQITMLPADKSIRLAFNSWRNQIYSVSEKALSADAFELIMRGWLGPLKVVMIEPTNLKDILFGWLFNHS